MNNQEYLRKFTASRVNTVLANVHYSDIISGVCQHAT